MNKTLKATGSAILVAAAILAVAALPAIAQNGPPPPPRPGGMEVLPPGLDNPMWPRPVMEQLSLTSDQMTQLRTIMDASRSNMQSLHGELRTDTQAAHKLSEGTYDASDAQALAAKELPTIEQIAIDAQTTKAQIYSTVLTATQQQTIASMTPPSRPPGGSNNSDSVLEQLTQELSLTSAQQSEIGSLLTQQQTACKADMSTIKSDFESYMKSASPGAFDEGAFKSAFTSAESSMSDIIVGDIKTKSQIWALLTPDQQTQLAQVHSAPPRGQGGPGGFGPPQGGDFGPPPGGGENGNDRSAPPTPQAGNY